MDIHFRLKQYVRMLNASLDAFIKVGFNRQVDRANGIYKVTASKSEALVQTIIGAVLSQAPDYSPALEKLTELRMYQHGKKLYSANEINESALKG